MVGFSRIWELQQKHLSQRKDNHLKLHGPDRLNELTKL